MNIKDENIKLNRKKFLLTAGTLAAVVPSINAFASDKKHDHGAHMASKVAEAAIECVSKGEECVNHCVEIIKAGDTSVAQCIATVNEAIAACRALASLSNYNSVHLKKLAAVCIDICAACEKECNKHAKKHKACEECAEACADCIKACKKI
ncbi:MAG: Csp1 family four helix bundle copper storage protein [Spirochaetia bacterium]|nr:Csp1 family four helix bundle copper storage protein [Spirochaetia bacterium]